MTGVQRQPSTGAPATSVCGPWNSARPTVPATSANTAATARKEHPELQCGMCLVLGHECFRCYQERVNDLMES